MAVQAFTSEHVRDLTGLSLRQLHYWDRTGFFSPQRAVANRRLPFSRIYSFRDVVGLRAIAVLRREHRVSLQHLRRVGSWLARRHDAPWSRLRFHVAGGRVFFEDPDTGEQIVERPDGQMALPFQMAHVADEMSAAVDRLRERRGEQIGKVVRKRYVAHGTPVLAGTRVPVSAVWNLHLAGWDEAAILREYPSVTAEDVRAAIAYAEHHRGGVRQDPIRPRICFLSDEGVPASVVAFLRDRGHEVRCARDELPSGASDQVLAACAADAGVVLLTWNQRLARGTGVAGPVRMAGAGPGPGRVTFLCPESRGLDCAERSIDAIERTYERVQRRGGRRLAIEVAEAGPRIVVGRR